MTPTDRIEENPPTTATATPRPDPDSVPVGGALGGVLRLIRPHQWAKNGLVVLPLFLAHATRDADKLAAVLLAVVAFCLCASAVYVVNDLLDLEADRHHPRKRHRPLASGRVTKPVAVAVFCGLFVAAFAVALLTRRPPFVAMLAAYFALSTAYSFYFKRKLLVDVFVLAGLYSLRILAGAVAADVPASPWLLAFSMFLFLSLAFAKRYSELTIAEQKEEQGLRGRGYLVQDLRVIETVGPTSGYLAALVVCEYMSSDAVRKLYAYPPALWLVCPILLYWITRVWFLARRRQLIDDPLVFAMRDWQSWLLGAATIALILAAKPVHG